LLNTGKVLVVGGTGAPALPSAELYDPATGTFTPTGSMLSGREMLAAILLPDGRVLAAGGWDGSTVLQSAEIYEPGTGTWTPTSSMNDARVLQTITRLPNGDVLVTGGLGFSGTTGPFHATNALQTAEIYRPGPGLACPSVLTAAMVALGVTSSADVVPAIQGLQTQAGVLQAQVSQLQSQLTVANANIAAQAATIESLVNQIFGLPPDANVATAARDAVRGAIAQAIAAVGTTDRRVQRAQRNFDQGLAALSAGDFRRAIREFEQAFDIARRILT
jgi:hypothetical protein